MTTDVITIFILIYLLTLLLSATELLPMSVAALFGALLTAYFGLSYGVFTYSDAMSFVDMRIIALIVGTMVVVGVAKKSGLFQFIALYVVRVAGGDPKRLFVTLNIAAAAVSMFLSDQTAMLLLTITVITITKLLKYDPVPFFISAAVMINLGGLSTLIGSTSNMIISVESGLSFAGFLSFLFLGELCLWALTITVLFFLFRSRLGRPKTLPRNLDPWEMVKNRKLLNRSVFLMTLMLVLFLSLGQIGVGPEAIALGCAILALVVSGLEPANVFRDLDWETIFFLTSFLFIVKGLEKTDALFALSQQFLLLTGGNRLAASIIILLVSGFMSTIASNAAVALTFIPIIKGLQGLDPTFLWGALVLGTNLGGMATPLSGSVSIMTMGAIKREGIKVSFAEFTKVGVTTTVIQLGFASLYLIMLNMV